MPVIAMLSRVSLLAVALAALALPRPAAAEALAPRARGDAPVADAPAKEGSAPSSTAEPGTRGPESLAIAGAALGGAAEAGDAGGAGGAAEACGAGAPSSQASLAPDLAARPPRRFPLPQGHLVPAIETGIITGMMLAWNASIGAAPWAQITEDTIGRNLRSNWVLDDDAYWINQVGHPYQGVFPYSAARSAGLGFWWSTAYPFVASAVWEYVGETTPPSINDQITTTIAGVVLGEAFHRISGMILDGPRSPGRVVAATLVAPMEAVNRALVGTEPAGPTPPFRAALSVGALTFDPDQGTPGRERVVPEIGARVSYGLPGDRRFRFERPFDRFELEATYSTEKDPIGTVFARGVVAGRTFEGERVRGLAGLALQFDFAALHRYRVSTSAVGLSAEGRWEASPRVAVEGAVTASAVLLGGAGYLSGRPDELRDYRLGPGGQAHLEVRLLALDRIAARLSARQYLVVGAGAIHGLERVSNIGGALQVRVLGPHALGVEGLLAHHSGDAGAGAPARSETGTSLRAYYAFRIGSW